MERVLVTGATGFIGRQLVAQLLSSRRYSVRCLVRATTNRDSLKEHEVEIVQADFNDTHAVQKAVRECDVIFNLAGTTKALSAKGFELANVIGPCRLAEACAAMETPPVLVHVSSLAAAGPSTLGKPRTESDPARPVSRYGKSKLEGEYVLKPFASQVPISIVRPPIVLGPGDRDGFELFWPIARFAVHLVPGFSKSEFSLVHCVDLCRGLLEIARRGSRLDEDFLSNGSPGEGSSKGVYFVADPERLRYADLGRSIALALGRNDKVWCIRCPMVGIWAAAAVGELMARVRRQPHILNFDKAREASAGSWSCDVSKLVNELGFQFPRTIVERLQEVAQWYRHNGWIQD